VTHGGRDLDRLGVLAQLRQALPSLRPTLLLGNLDAQSNGRLRKLVQRRRPG